MIITTILTAVYCLPVSSTMETCHSFIIGVWESDSVLGGLEDMRDCYNTGKGYYDHLEWSCQNKELTERYPFLSSLY